METLREVWLTCWADDIVKWEKDLIDEVLFESRFPNNAKKRSIKRDEEFIADQKTVMNKIIEVMDEVDELRDMVNSGDIVKFNLLYEQNKLRTLRDNATEGQDTGVAKV